MNNKITFLLTAFVLFFITTNGFVRTESDSGNKKRIAKHLLKAGLRYYKNGKYNAALKHFLTALKYYEKYEEAIYNAGCMYALLKKTEYTVYYLTRLFLINKDWKKNLLKERDFRFIRNSALFKLFMKYWMNKKSETNIIKKLKGTYKSLNTARSYNGRTVSKYNFQISGNERIGFIFNISYVRNGCEFAKIRTIKSFYSVNRSFGSTHLIVLKQGLNKPMKKFIVFSIGRGEAGIRVLFLNSVKNRTNTGVNRSPVNVLSKLSSVQFNLPLRMRR